MHELIFRFLLDSGYPRGAIVTDHGSSETGQEYRPTFMIVDPRSAGILAIIEVIESGTGENLSTHALHAGQYAAQLERQANGEAVQAFVIQLDRANPIAEEQVGFYKLMPGKKMKKVSSFAFPDLESLRVERKIKALNGQVLAATPSHDQPVSNLPAINRNEKIIYTSACVLLLLGFADWAFTQSRGTGLFSVQQVLLLLSAAALVLYPILVNQLRR